ncbi:uncharacterized protein LOC108040849 [Drosophila rhopaloa]|uniref:Uncharacterized protein LOC108040849 n=1 Tax=Drosophila rhopaloa TaxID=1041015 RepID=A0A6P4E7G2_DRORH|nr:uncharacterized protein LOC108040849 [Drosophila rhopaloa]
MFSYQKIYKTSGEFSNSFKNFKDNYGTMFLKYIEGPLVHIIITLGVVRAMLDSRLEFITKLEGDTETLFEFNFRLLGRQHFLNGTIIFHVDLNNDFELSNELFVHKDGEWKPSNIGVSYRSCAYLRIIYDKYFASSLKDSNFPTGKCPIEKGEYYLRNVDMSADSWAHYANTGLNKFILKVKKDNISYGGVECILVLSEKVT